LSGFCLAMSCFSGFRGNIRHRVYGMSSPGAYYMPSTAVVNAVVQTPGGTAHAPAYLDSFGVYGVNGVASAFLFQDSMVGSRTFVPDGSQFGLVADVEVSSRLGYRYTGLNLSSSTTVKEYAFKILHYTGGQSGGLLYGSYAHLTSAGDDFEFVGFLGVPTLILSGPGYFAGTPFT